MNAPPEAPEAPEAPEVPGGRGAPVACGPSATGRAVPRAPGQVVPALSVKTKELQS